MSLRWEEKDALVECYGEFHAGLLFEIVLLFDRLERRELSSYEATKLALARFATLMQEHLPAMPGKVWKHIRSGLPPSAGN